MNAPENVIESPLTGHPPDFEALFHLHYESISRAIARVVRDPARAEDLAVETFWKFWRHPSAAKGSHAAGWLYRTAIRMALDELRKETRRAHYQTQASNRDPVPDPEQLHAAGQERRRVELILASLDAKQAELLLLRSNGLSYNEVAAALDLNPASVGTLISRAQQAFRKQYINQYGEPKS